MVAGESAGVTATPIAETDKNESVTLSVSHGGRYCKWTTPDSRKATGWSFGDFRRHMGPCGFSNEGHRCGESGICGFRRSSEGGWAGGRSGSRSRLGGSLAFHSIRANDAANELLPQCDPEARRKSVPTGHRLRYTSTCPSVRGMKPTPFLRGGFLTPMAGKL